MSTCCCCLETYRRDTNPALTCNPCGHGVCEPCLSNWRRSGRSNSNTCPQCRSRITSTTVNRDLMDAIEQLQDNSVLSPMANEETKGETKGENEMTGEYKTNNNLVNFQNINVVQRKELIHDKSQFAVYVLDNSVSMEEPDGKKVEINKGIIRIKNGITRWEEAEQKISDIADYNIKRKMPAIYYLLNPLWSNHWKENKDYVFIKPTDNCDDKLKFLKKMTHMDSIRGSTPLGNITRYIKKSLCEFVNETPLDNICYNIITDGCPNNRVDFERELKYLASNFNIFLTINLCTDDQRDIDYYNDLDVKIGTELGGMDVIDDFKGEQLEVINAGNTFITYTYDMHVSRMAGCNSVVADSLDEHYLSVFHANKLVKELLGNPSDLPHWTDREVYIKKVIELNKKVYNLYYGKHTDLININALNNIIWFYQLQKDYNVDILLKNKYYILVPVLAILFMFAI